MIFNRHSLDSPLGQILITTDASGAVDSLRFAERVWLGEAQRPAAEESCCESPGRLQDAIARYFAGDFRALERLEVAPRSVPLHERVKTALQRIPPGSSLSYSELARSAGLEGPRGAVDIGGVLAANPVALIVPCHRIVGKNGDLKGFAWGVERKRWLLEHEGALRARSLAF